MALDIIKLLKKKKLTGEEVGKILIYNTTNSYEQVLKNGSSENVVPDEILRQLVSNLPSREEWEKFKLYDSINEWVVHNFSIASAYEQQAQLNLEKLLNNLNMVGVCESVRDFYYTLPAIMTKKDYEKTIEKRKEELLNTKLKINLADIFHIAKDEVINEYRKNPRKKSIGKELYKIYSKMSVPEHIKRRCKDFFNEEIEKGIFNMWCVFEFDDTMEFYKCFEDKEEMKSLEEYIKDFEAFKTDFKEAYSMIMEEMKNYFPEVENLPLKDWFIKKYEYKQLYELNYFDIFTNTLNNRYIMFDKNFKAIFNGIAILRKEDEKNFKKVKPLEDLINTFCFISLEQLAKGGKEVHGEMEYYKDLWAVLRRSLYFLQGYNKALDIIIENYDIKDIEIFKSRYNWFENKVNGLNHMIDLRLSILESNVHENLNQREEKAKIYKKIFEKIDLEKLTTPKRNVKEATALISQGKISRATPLLINLVADYDLVKKEA